MLKEKIKKVIAKTTKKLVNFSVKKGCMSQDDVINKLSSYKSISTKYGNIKFFCPGDIPIWRVNTFFTKEPETIEWIDSFKAGEIFLDIGANIGLYSLYANLKGHKSYAIEPMSENFFILQRNIKLNKLAQNLPNLEAYCLCLYNKNKLDTLKIRNPAFGQAENSFSENIGAFEEKYQYSFQQGVVGITLDYFTSQTIIPNHIKIDVDGHELKVLEGAANTLQNNLVKTILIEVNEESKNYNKMCELMANHGFKLLEKKASAMITNGKYKMFKNYIFAR